MPYAFTFFTFSSLSCLSSAVVVTCTSTLRSSTASCALRPRYRACTRVAAAAIRSASSRCSRPRACACTAAAARVGASPSRSKKPALIFAAGPTRAATASPTPASTRRWPGRRPPAIVSPRARPRDADFAAAACRRAPPSPAVPLAAGAGAIAERLLGRPGATAVEAPQPPRPRSSPERPTPPPRGPPRGAQRWRSGGAADSGATQLRITVCVRAHAALCRSCSRSELARSALSRRAAACHAPASRAACPTRTTRAQRVGPGARRRGSPAAAAALPARRQQRRRPLAGAVGGAAAGEVGGPLGDAGPAAWTPTQVVAAADAADDGGARRGVRGGRGRRRGAATLDEVDLLAPASARSASASGCSTRSPSCAAPRPSSARARRTPTAARRSTARPATPS